MRWMEQRSNFLQILKVIFLILSSDTWIAADRGRKRYFNGGEREMVRDSDHNIILHCCSYINQGWKGMELTLHQHSI